MEPQLFSCGLALMTSWLHSCQLLQWSRNFSVADWLSKYSKTPSKFWLQWSRNFSVADWRKKGIREERKKDFNGAATFQLRIAGDPTIFMAGGNFTSMEPQLFSCGLLSQRAVNHIPLHNFNGAATFQLRIGEHSTQEPTPHRHFNGAATFQLRIAGDPTIFMAGGNFTSMEPQLFSCGLLSQRAVNHIPLHNFNGAATFQLRIGEHSTQEPTPHRHFNGAATFQLRIARAARIIFTHISKLQWSRNFSVADWMSLLGNLFIVKELQWSRNFSVADCTSYCLKKVPNTFTSMEPQLFSCGLNWKSTGRRLVIITSMEPQLFSCGLLTGS